uniref:hypothetical protein n=1 Tax=Flavobacterium ovatum TaxID=1928857 RepID=UPI003F4EBEAF
MIVLPVRPKLSSHHVKSWIRTIFSAVSDFIKIGILMDFTIELIVLKVKNTPNIMTIKIVDS